MQVILLERIENLGQMGDVVTVKNGFARNYLLPQEKAMRATKANKEVFEKQKAHLEAQNLKRKKEAESAGKKIDGKEITLIRQAGETGQLYGSVRTHDIREAMKEQHNISIEKSQIGLNAPLKEVGMTEVRIKLHAEVDAMVKINIAKSDDEATNQREATPEVMPVDEEVQEALTEEPKKTEATPEPVTASNENQEEEAETAEDKKPAAKKSAKASQKK